MKTTSIVDLMTADHTKILKLLQDVEKSIGIELVSLMKVFDTFEWELEKHIFTEEKAIFSSHGSWQGGHGKGVEAYSRYFGVDQMEP